MRIVEVPAMDDGDAVAAVGPAAGGPLSAITVLDLSTQLPGPYATMLLRALGARVIKVEPPGGDVARRIDPAMFARVNAGKELIEVDLKTASGRRVVHGLAGDADAFIEGFRPGVATRLDVDRETLMTINGRLVYCSLSGFGQSGPLAHLPAHDVNFLALAGGVSPNSNHRDISIPVVDLAAGTSAALSIVAALAVHPREGTYLDMSLLDAAVVWSSIKRMVPGEELEPSYGLFVTSDRQRVAISVMEDDVWQRLCRALGWDEWSQDSAFQQYSARRRRALEISRRLEDCVRSRCLDYWLELADRYELPMTAVLDASGAHSHPQVVARRLTEGELLQAPLPVAVRVPVHAPAGRIDQDGGALRGEAGSEHVR